MFILNRRLYLIRALVKVATKGNSLRMTIPVDVARGLNLKSGDYVEIGLDNNHMIVKKA